MVRTGLAIAVLVGTWSSAVTIAWAGSYPDGGLVATMVAVVLVGLTGVAWLILAISELARRTIPLVVTMTLIPVVIIGGAGFAARIELPLLARFALSRPAFDQVIADRGEADPGAPCPTRIGSYVSRWRTIGSDTYLGHRAGRWFLDSVGFVYARGGTDRSADRHLDHIRPAPRSLVHLRRSLVTRPEGRVYSAVSMSEATAQSTGPMRVPVSTGGPSSTRSRARRATSSSGTTSTSTRCSPLTSRRSSSTRRTRTPPSTSTRSSRSPS